MHIETFKIESNAEADIYLAALMAKPKYPTPDEIETRAYQLTDDPKLREYFISAGKQLLAATPEP